MAVTKTPRKKPVSATEKVEEAVPKSKAAPAKKAAVKKADAKMVEPKVVEAMAAEPKDKPAAKAPAKGKTTRGHDQPCRPAPASGHPDRDLRRPGGGVHLRGCRGQRAPHL